MACVPWATAFRAKHIAQALAKPAAIPLPVPPADSDVDLRDSEVDDEDLLEGEGGESEEVVEGSMSEEPEAGGAVPKALVPFSRIRSIGNPQCWFLAKSQAGNASPVLASRPQ